MKNEELIKFYKNNPKGISLIVLVITIIVIIILASTIVISISNNNPISEANKARLENDIDSMQAIFTTTVSKIITSERSSVLITAGQINSITSGTSETSGEVNYTLKNPRPGKASTGKIIFDKGTNGDNTYYTGKKLPIYAAGETKWYVDDEGNLSLGIGNDIAYGNGSYANDFENILANKYEDIAGDEDGATDGMLHIGDYVDYNSIASGVTEKTVENGYVYTSPNDKSGVAEALADGFSTLSNVNGQKFTTKEDLKWRVLGIQGNNIIITTETAIVPDSPVTFLGFPGYVMYGASSYLYGPQELNNISKIYGNGDLAESARSMKIDDVNKITGVTVTDTEIIPSEADENNLYGIEYNFSAGSTAGWSPEAWLNREDGDTSLGISGKSTSYMYYLDNTSLKTSDSLVRASVIDNTGNSIYGLASVGIEISTYDGNEVAFFGPAAVVQSSVASYTGNFCSMPEATLGRAYGVRPVVVLKSNIKGEIIATDANGVSTWHIELL